MATDSWDQVGGSGSLAVYETNLSLVISQTKEIHEQIADLLEQQRRLQDVQVTFRLESVMVDGKQAAFDFAGEKLRVLNPEHIEVMRPAIKAAAPGAIRRGPAVTLFDGQTAELQLDLGIQPAAGTFSPEERLALKGKAIETRAGAYLRLTPDVSKDRRTVRISLATGAGKEKQQVSGAVLRAGQMIVLDVSDYLSETAGGKTAALMITPDLIIPEEEEAKATAAFR